MVWSTQTAAYISFNIIRKYNMYVKGAYSKWNYLKWNIERNGQCSN